MTHEREPAGTDAVLADVERALTAAQRDAGKAFVEISADAARRDARRGRSRGASRAHLPLAGMTLAVKDNIDVAGSPTRAGSTLLRGAAATEDAPVIAALRSRGGIVVGKTRMSEFAADAVCIDCANPLDPERISGGSSGGSAVAVGLGVVPVGVGTDTAGSVRIPAALCGLVGFRLRRDRFPAAGVIPLAPSFDSCGFITRDVPEVVRVWQSLTGRTVRPSAMTIAFPHGAFLRTVDDAVGDAFDVDIQRLSSVARTVPVTLSDPSSSEPERFFPIATEMLAVHAALGLFPDALEGYGGNVRRQLELAAGLTVEQRDRGARAVERIRAEYEDVLRRADAIAVPTTPSVAPLRAAVAGRELTATRSLTRFTFAANLCDLAAITVPSGEKGPGGLPVGLQLIARDEATALRSALLFRQAS